MMNTDVMALLVVIGGLLLRFGLPVLITGLAIAYLRYLDARWQAEAEHAAPEIEPVQCWEVKDCTPEQRANCKAYPSNLPCWQVKRLPNGYLAEECLDCNVFQKAPVPVHA